ncbi:hypothetical protein BHL37_00135 [Bacillus cereus]|nr:hypothetical protein BHL37_00135 [Bacillus cereus]PJZ19868.1 hypothetical protein CEW46_20985 [Bacillus cereus]
MARPNDPLYLGNAQFPQGQWGLRRINPEAGWDLLPRRGPKIIVAVIDSGVNPHEDLVGNVLFNRRYNAVTDTVGGDVTDNALVNHGTGIAGNIAATTNNLIGMAGTSFNTVNILPIKVVDDTQGEDQENVEPAALARAIDYAWRSGARVINMSVTQGDINLPDGLANTIRYTAFPEVQAAINRAFAAGAVLVAMAGNDGIGQVAFPAAYDNVIAVSGITMQDTPIAVSNSGPQIDVAAPGDLILTMDGNNFNGYVSNFTGTSIATSFVGGLAALIFSVNPKLRNTDVVRIIEGTAHQPGTPGTLVVSGRGKGKGPQALPPLPRTAPRWNQTLGFGVIDVTLAMSSAAILRRP